MHGGPNSCSFLLCQFRIFGCDCCNSTYWAATQVRNTKQCPQRTAKCAVLSCWWNNKIGDYVVLCYISLFSGCRNIDDNLVGQLTMHSLLHLFQTTPDYLISSMIPPTFFHPLFNYLFFFLKPFAVDLGSQGMIKCPSLWFLAFC